MKIVSILAFLAGLALFINDAKCQNSNYENSVKSAFRHVMDAGRCCEPKQLVENIHPDAARTFRVYFEARLRRHLLKNPALLQKSGIPQDYHSLSDSQFLELVYGTAMRLKPKLFVTPDWKELRIIGMLQDGEDWLMVYAFPSNDPDRLDQTVVARFRTNGERTMIVSLPFPAAVREIWSEVEVNPRAKP